TVSGKDLTRGIIAESTSTSQMKDKTDLDMYIIADAKIGETIIDIRGKTIWVDRDVSLAVSSPNGNLITVAQITPTSNGDFSTKINIGGTMWKEDGTYTVTAFQGDASELKDSVKVEIAKGVVVPEFGTIAMMVLAVAIISIIVVTTKSRVIPKF
ncbi:MAG: PEFG-CTERM sorting domain-containing protein, partial [Nitrosopumilus sp.]|nr:PEFG-CTERM sorting domain-containing protein [Nitrosopumilus sp.]